MKKTTEEYDIRLVAIRDYSEPKESLFIGDIEVVSYDDCEIDYIFGKKLSDDSDDCFFLNEYDQISIDKGSTFSLCCLNKKEKEDVLKNIPYWCVVAEEETSIHIYKEEKDIHAERLELLKRKKKLFNEVGKIEERLAEIEEQQNNLI